MSIEMYRVVGGPPQMIDGVPVGFGEEFPGDAVDEEYLALLLASGQVIRVTNLIGGPLTPAPDEPEDPESDEPEDDQPEE